LSSEHKTKVDHEKLKTVKVPIALQGISELWTWHR